MDNVIEIIRDLGFPIACVVALFWQNTRLNDQHKEEMNKMVEAVNNNTQVLTALKEKIGG